MRGQIVVLCAWLLPFASAQNQVNCPQGNSGALRPHPTDCTLYYECIDGTPYLRRCADGLHFSHSKSICTLPELARCKAGGSTETTTTERTTPSSPQTETTSSPEETTTTSQSTKEPFETTTTTPKTETTPSSPQTETTKSPEETTEETKEVTEQTTKKPDVPKCPPSNSNDLVLLPHADCDKFYVCDWGEPIQQQCPAGLHFNPVLDVCDYPAAAGCTTV